MADLKLVGAVAIKVRPNAKGFKRETDDQVRDQLKGYSAEIKVKVKAETDATKAKADAKAAGKEIEKQVLNLKVGLDYDSVLAAQKKLNTAVKGLEAVEIPVTLDTEGIADANAKLALMRANAKVNMTIVPDDKGFQQVLDKIAQVRRQKMEIPLEFGVSDKELDDLEAGMKAALFEASKITITYGNDKASIEKAISQVEAELAKLDTFELPVQLSSEGLEEAKDILESKLAESVVELTVNYNDQGSLKNARTRLEAMLTELGSEPLEVQFNEDAIKAEINKINQLIEEELLDQSVTIAPQVISLSFSRDRASLQKTLDQLDKELAKFKEIRVDVNANEESIQAMRDDVQKQMDKTPIKLQYEKNAEGFQAALNAIEDEIHRLKNKPLAEIELALDVDGLRAQALKFRQEIHAISRDNGSISVELNRQAANQTLEDMNRLVHEMNGKKVEANVHLAGTEAAAAQLAFLGRDRIVTFFANVNTRSLATAEGALKSLAGLNVLDDAAKMLENVFTKFDQVSVSAVNIATVVGSLADTLVYAVTSAASIGSDMTKSLGLLAAAPAVLGAATVGYTIFTAAFNNFFDAFNKDPKIAKQALEELPPLARKTVESITGLYKGLANPIQERFWENVGTTLADSIETLYPKLKESLLNSTDAVGDFVAGIGRSMNKLALSDDFDKMFAGFDGFFRNLSGASEPFFDAWNKFGVQGAQLLPLFGTWITELAVQFNAWATALGPDGITKFIMEGVNSLKAMWDIGVDVVDMFGAIAKASGTAGAKGLQDFEQGLRNLADRMNGEPWQTKASKLFEGARKGASDLMDGFRDLGGVLGDSADQFSRILHMLGTLGGTAITNLSAIFGVEDFQNGVLVGLDGLLKMMQDLKPAAEALGGIIGSLGVIAGSAFSSVGDTVSRMFVTVEQIVDKLTVNIAKIAPKLSQALGAAFSVLTPLLLGMADALNGILGIIANMDDSFVTLTVAAGAFFALRALSSKFFESLSGTSYFRNLEQNWVNQQVSAGRFVTELKNVDGQLRKVQTVTGNFSPSRAIFDDVTGAVGRTTGSIKTLYEQAKVDGMGPFRASMSLAGTAVTGLATTMTRGLLGVLGGPWGVALTLAAVGLGIYAQKQAEAEAMAKRFGDTLDKTTGAITRSTEAMAAQNIIDDKNDGFYLLELGAKTASEAIEALGLKVTDVGKIFANGGEEYDDFVKDLEEGIAAFEEAGIQSDNLGNITAGNTEKLDAWHAKMKLTKGAITQMDLVGLLSFAQAQAGAIDDQQRATDQLNEKLSIGEQRVRNFNDAMRIYNDSTSTADAKTRAFKDALDILGGKELNLEDAQKKVNDAMRNVGGQMREFSEVVNGELVTTMKVVGGAFRDAQGNVYDFNGIIDSTSGVISTASEAGSNLHGVLRNVQQNVADVVGEMKAQKKPAQEIIAYIDGQREAFIKMGEGAGISRDLVEKAWDHMMGANPGEIKTLITAEGVEDAKSKVKEYKVTLDEIDTARAVAEIAGDDKVLGEMLTTAYKLLADWNEATAKATLDLDPAPAQAKKDQMLLDLLDLSRTNPKILVDIDPTLLQIGKELILKDLEDLGNQRPSPEVWAKTEDAQNLLNAIDERLKAIDAAKPKPKVEAETAEADAKLTTTKSLADVLGLTNPKPVVDPQTGDANNKLTGVKGALDGIATARPSPFVDAQTAEASGRLGGLWRQIDPFNNKTYSFSVIAKYSQAGTPVDLSTVDRQMADGGILNSRGAMRFANGGIHRYAGGGIENHVAQIQRAGGPVRIWAEPETKAEAYIPYAQAKRPRSVRILRQVAKDFGYDLAKGTHYASGGINGGSTRTSHMSADVHIGTMVTTDMDAAVRKLNQTRRDALAVAGIR